MFPRSKSNASKRLVLCVAFVALIDCFLVWPHLITTCHLFHWSAFANLVLPLFIYKVCSCLWFHPLNAKKFSTWIYHNSEIHMIDLDSQCTVYICHVSLARVSLGGREGIHAELAKSETTRENASKGHPSSNLSRRTRPISLATKARFLLLMASSLTPFGKVGGFHSGDHFHSKVHPWWIWRNQTNWTDFYA